MYVICFHTFKDVGSLGQGVGIVGPKVEQPVDPSSQEHHVGVDDVGFRVGVRDGLVPNH